MLDWSTISTYLGSLLVSPWFATANIATGFIGNFGCSKSVNTIFSDLRKEASALFTVSLQLAMMKRFRLAEEIPFLRISVRWAKFSCKDIAERR